MDAAGQIFYSLGVGFGTLTLFSTGHKPNNNFYMDAVMSALGNCGTSLWASIIMFSLFGFKASYEVKECKEMSRNASVDNNGSCSREEIFQKVGKPLIIYKTRTTTWNLPGPSGTRDCIDIVYLAHPSPLLCGG